MPRLRGPAAEAYQRLGDVRQRLGRLDEAASAYRDAIALMEQEAAPPPVRLARAYSDLGRVLRMTQKTEEGEKALRRAAAVLDEAGPAVSARPEARYELARALYSLGQRDMLRGGPPKDGGKRGPPGDRGKGWPFGKMDGPPERKGGGPPRPPEIARAMTLLERLADDHPAVPEYKHLLACCCRETGRDGRLRGVGLMRELVSDYPRVPDYVLDLCEALAGGQIGGPAGGPPGPPWGIKAGPSEDRGAELREAVRLSDALAKQYPNVPDYRAAHARYLDQLGLHLRRTGTPEEVEKAHRAAFEEQSALVQSHPDVPAYQFWLSLFERSYGRALAGRGEQSAAVTRLRSAITRAETLLKKDARLGGVRPFLGMAYDDLADALSAAGKPDEAADAEKKSREYGGRPGGFRGKGGFGKGPRG